MANYGHLVENPEAIAQRADAARYPAPKKIAAMRRDELGPYLNSIGIPVDCGATKDTMILAYSAYQAGVPIGTQAPADDMKIQQLRKLCSKLDIKFTPSDGKTALQAKLDEFANATDAS